jgi:argininosuccinate lyase
MPHKKNPDVFELIRGKCNLLQGLHQQLALLTSNLPSGYHREMQLAKAPLVEAFQEIKACVEMMHFSLSKIEVRKNITDDVKYKYVYSVENLNELVNNGYSFRDAYMEVSDNIKNNKFKAIKDIHHTMIGSIGNLCLKEIKIKMNKAIF